MKDLDTKIIQLQYSKNQDAINQLIDSYTPFIIKTISNLKGQYLDINNDDELTIGMMAFNEAIEKYVAGKGSFINFAKLVIESRVKTYLMKNKTFEHTDYEDIIENVNEDLVDEIKIFEQTLLMFGLDFEMLVDHAPKHKDTRTRAVKIGKQTSQVPAYVDHIYLKRRLPITLISSAFNVSMKIIKKSKHFILSVVIIFDKKLKHIEEWLK